MKSNKNRNKGYITPLPFHYLSAFSILVYCDVVCVCERVMSILSAGTSFSARKLHTLTSLLNRLRLLR